MPHISVECGELDEQQKEDLARELTRAAAGIMHVPAEFFSVTIRELPDKNYSIGGETIDKIKARWREGTGSAQ